MEEKKIIFLKELEDFLKSHLVTWEKVQKLNMK